MVWNIGMVVYKQARCVPDKAAIIDEGNPITYRDLNEEADRIARLFQAPGPEEGERVAVWVHSHPHVAVYSPDRKTGRDGPRQRAGRDRRAR